MLLEPKNESHGSGKGIKSFHVDPREVWHERSRPQREHAREVECLTRA
jgi:ribosomal protein L19E